MLRACDVCRTRYPAKRASSRYCSPRCRKRAQRVGEAGPTREKVVPLHQPERPPVGDLAALTERTLQAAGRLNTWEGQSALALAHRTERAAIDTGSSYASLHRELRSAMAAALQGTNSPKSALQQRRDELATLRARKHG